MDPYDCTVTLPWYGSILLVVAIMMPDLRVSPRRDLQSEILDLAESSSSPSDGAQNVLVLEAL